LNSNQSDQRTTALLRPLRQAKGVDGIAALIH
jgi:hypothetical protein